MCVGVDAAASPRLDAEILEIVIGPDDPRADDVTALLERHLEFARSCTPPDFVFALDIDALSQPGVTVCSARRDGVLLAVAALKELDSSHGELKSMHTDAEARGQGVAASMVEHLVGLARRRGYDQISLETGSQAEFEPARTCTDVPASSRAAPSPATRTVRTACS